MEASEVPDHCRIYALSDLSDAEFRGSCDHLHNESCVQCYELEEVMRTIEEECSSGINTRNTLTRNLSIFEQKSLLGLKGV